MSTIQTAYAGSAEFVITLASLGNGATRQSTVIDNTTNKYMDYQVGGKITAGTNSAGYTIEVLVFAPYNDTTYPGPLGASDATIAFNTRDEMFESCVLISTLTMDGTVNKVHYLHPISVAQAFGGWLPPKFGIVVNNLSNNTLNATGSNHVLSYKPIYSTIV